MLRVIFFLVVVLLISFLVVRMKQLQYVGKALAERYNIDYPAVIAHRGLSYLAPEETRASFERAREIGADYLEMDLQRTKDGVIIALHDDTFERTTNIAEVFPSRQKETVDQFTYEEILQLDAGSWFNQKYPDRANEAFKGLKVLTLDEIIDIAESGEKKLGLVIESKAAERYPGYEKAIIEILTRRGLLQQKGRIVLESFVHESLKTFKELAPETPRIVLIDEDPAAKWEDVLKEAKELGQAVGPSVKQATPWNVYRAHEMGLLVYPYTVNEAWQIWLLRQFGVDGIFTDHADRALEMGW